MVISSYANFFSLFIFSLFLIPAIVLGMLGKKIKWYGIIISIPALCLLFGLTSNQMIQFAVFIVCETILIFSYYFFKKRANSEFVYYLTFALSMLPIFLLKTCVHIERFNFLGFLGVSYISFRVWQLIIEIHDEHIKKLSLPEMLYFTSFFPTISCGPIDRFQRFKDDLEASIKPEEYLNDYLIFGIKKIFIGILYKFALAMLINTFVIEKLPAHAESFLGTLVYMYAYTFYLFFDFAGYSNLAIGTSYILGIKTPENFNKPFLAHNMKEFWDRWHISLSSWFRDYLYITLGGNRFGKYRTMLNKLIVFFATGFWHGANVTFILWGLFHGLFSVLEQANVIPITKMKGNIIGHIYTMIVVTIGFVLFRSENLSQAAMMLTKMFTISSVTLESTLLLKQLLSYYTLFILFICVVACLGIVPKLYQKGIVTKNVVECGSYVFAMVLLVLSVIDLSASTFNPFIYFQF